MTGPSNFHSPSKSSLSEAKTTLVNSVNVSYNLYIVKIRALQIS